MKIVVAMSGGVDSSTTAALLQEQGHELIGLAMKTHAAAPKGNRACCTPDDMRDARHMAECLDIPFYVLDYAEVFKKTVIEPFAQAYLAGMTPNPCVVCNDKVKFKPLLAQAKLLGADKLATGHYARLHREGTQLYLARALDRSKDQSYFLYRLTAAQLEDVLFPLAEMTKPQVRAHAQRLGLQVAEKPESQEICFVGERGYAATVEAVAGTHLPGGEIVDDEGKVLGTHTGIHNFTVGQRRGLGISAAQPLFVSHLDPQTQRVEVSPQNKLARQQIRLTDVVWTHSPPSPDDTCVVALRHRDKERLGKVSKDEQGWLVQFDEAQIGGAPGQAAVVYRSDGVVLGGGIIAREPERPNRGRLPLYSPQGLATVATVSGHLIAQAVSAA